MKRMTRCLAPALAVLAVAMLAMVSCATQYQIEAVRSLGTVAVVSVRCDRLIDMGDNKDFQNAAKLWARSETFDLAPAASRIRSDVFGTYAQFLPFRFLDERELLESEGYRGLASDGVALLSARQASVPAGYLAVANARRRDVAATIARLPKADGYLWAEVRFSLVTRSEFMGTVYASLRADLTVTVYDRAARPILSRTEYAEDPTEMRIPLIGMANPADFSTGALRAAGRASVKLAAWLEGRAAR